MPLIFELESKIRAMIDELKGLCSQNGLSNQASEERIITSVFLYKFLNDKFLYNLKKWADEVGTSVDEILADKDMIEASTCHTKWMSLLTTRTLLSNS